MVALAAAALLAGPKILLFFPIWLMGLLAWRWHAKLPRRLGPPLAFGAVAAWIGLEGFGGEHLFTHSQTAWFPNFSAYDYIIGVLVTLLILGLANSPLPMPGAAVERPIRFLAGTTFGLYLLHFPLMYFFGTIIPGLPERLMHGLLVFGLTLGVAISLSHVIEQQKGPLKRTLRSGLDLLRRKRLRLALERQGLP